MAASGRADGETGRRGWLPALGLFLLAPLVGEFLLGNLPISFLGALVAVAPLYGGGALLIREVGRRGGLGWPGLLALCLAFGVVEEAFVTQSLFNQDYLGLGLGYLAVVPGLEMGAWWTVFVLGLHAVWSTAVPIMLVEALVPGRRRTPWLGPVGLVLVAVLFVAGCAMTFMFQPHGFLATPLQFTGAGVVVAALVGWALWRGRGSAGGAIEGRPTPRPLAVAATSFACGSAFVGAANLAGAETAWISLGVMLLAAGLGGWAVWRWSRRAGWSQLHVFAVAAGLVLTYVWLGFVQVPSVGGADATTDLIGNAVFSAAALLLLVVIGRRLQREAAAA